MRHNLQLISIINTKGVEWCTCQRSSNRHCLGILFLIYHKVRVYTQFQSIYPMGKGIL
jgi:hypothetical protein